MDRHRRDLCLVEVVVAEEGRLLPMRKLSEMQLDLVLPSPSRHSKAGAIGQQRIVIYLIPRTYHIIIALAAQC